MRDAKGAQAPQQSNETQATQPKYPRKITLKEVGAQPSNEDKAAMLLDSTKEITLARIYGVAGAFKPGNSDHGPFVKFMGQFKAVNMRTGEIFIGTTLILPRFLEEQLHGHLSAGTVGVEFAFEVSAKGDQPGAKKSATGYTYTAKPLIGFAENSALAALEAKIGGGNVAQLSAPKK